MKKFFKPILLILSSIMVMTLSSCVSVYPFSRQAQTAARQIPSDSTPAHTITLNLWHIWATESDTNRIPFEKALADWNNAHPEIQIVAEGTEGESYKSKLRTAIAVNEVPDIFFSWGAGFSKTFIEAGKVLPLNNYLDDSIRNSINDGCLENFTYDGTLYGFPTFIIAGIFYCNEEMFNQYNIKIPETYSELLEAIDLFNQHQITPMAVGLKDGWPGIFYQNILAIRTAGINKCVDALNKKISFMQPEFIESAQRVQELVNAGAFDARSMQLTRHEAELCFINGKVPMFYGGSWAVGSMERDDSLVKNHVVVKNFPFIEGASGDAKGFLGGAIDGFMISANTPYKQESVNTLASLCASLSKESYISGAGIPAWKVDLSGEKVSPLNQEVAKLLEDRDGFVLAWDTFLSGTEAQVHISLVSKLFANTITPEHFAKEMQKLNQKH